MLSPSSQTPSRPDESRRNFLTIAGLGLAGAALGGAGQSGGLISPAAAQPALAATAEARNSNVGFVERVYEARVAAAEAVRKQPVPQHVTNGDETLYPNRIGSDTRGLPHDARGEVEPKAFEAALKAYRSGDPADFEAIPLAGTRKQVNPIGSLAISLTGLNASQFSVPVPPTLASADRGAEAVELYWQALLRDVPFSDYRNDTSNPLVLAAVEELNKLSGFRGPRQDGRVTPETLFRGAALYADASSAGGTWVVPPGALVGPYISQFLLKDAPYGTQTIGARVRTATPANEYLTNYEEWLRVQNGNAPASPTKYDATPRFVSTGRDLAEYAHGGPAATWAASLLLASSAAAGGFGIPLSPSNPTRKSKTQAGGASTFAAPYIQGLIALGTSRVIRAAYWQKFYVHRTVRPEAYGGLVHHRTANKVDAYPVHGDILNSQALARSAAKNGTHLLSHVYPEGAPLHSSYPGGASAIAAVGATLLKAFFDEDAVIPNPVQPDPDDPSRVIPWQGPPLTVGGELNKLALNYGLGRNWSGIHWRSDGAASLALAEELAISLLREERTTFREVFDGFGFTRFDGARVTI